MQWVDTFLTFFLCILQCLCTVRQFSKTPYFRFIHQKGKKNRQKISINKYGQEKTFVLHTTLFVMIKFVSQRPVLRFPPLSYMYVLDMSILPLSVIL